MNPKTLLFVILTAFPCVLFGGEPASAPPDGNAATLNTEERQAGGEEIRELIRKLGDDSYIVRQRAELQLLRIGIDAFSELKKAMEGDDVEIARRAERILGQFELVYLGQEDDAVRIFVDLYATEQNLAQKATYIWALANPMSDGFPDGEGFRTLCRIARFDPEKTLRVEAVKSLIALPPFAPSKQRKWYRGLLRQFSDPGEDELFQLIHDFARLRCELDTLKENAEKAAEDDANTSGKLVDYPVPLPVDAALKERLRRFGDRLVRFQSVPENSAVQPGNMIDILLFYALAELQDLAGLTEQRDRAVHAAREIRTEPVRSDNPLLPIDPLSGRLLVDHYFTGCILMERNRLHWARRHFELVAAESEPVLQVGACYLIANIGHLLNDLPEAIRYLEREIEILDSDEYKSKSTDSEDRKKDTLARKFFYLAQTAAEAGDWQKAAEHVDTALKYDPCEIDTIILRHEICRRLPGLSQEYRNRMKTFVERAIVKVEQQMREGKRGASRPQVACNQVAWLLANTGGDYATAKALIDVTIKIEPESPVYLDTLSHVFALGKEYDRAIETQQQAIRLAPEAVVFRQALKRFVEARDAAK